nr:MAG TPA: hypothetical protein [Caudoviricetes sp.]
MQFNNTICKFNRKWVCSCFSCLFMLYYHPLQNPKKPRSYKGFADSRRKEDDRKDIHRISFLSATARVFVTFHT